MIAQTARLLKKCSVGIYPVRNNAPLEFLTGFIADENPRGQYEEDSAFDSICRFQPTQ